MSGPEMLANTHFIYKMMKWIHSFILSFVQGVELPLCSRPRDWSTFSAFMKLLCQWRAKTKTSETSIEVNYGKWYD